MTGIVWQDLVIVKSRTPVQQFRIKAIYWSTVKSPQIWLPYVTAGCKKILLKKLFKQFTMRLFSGLHCNPGCQKVYFSQLETCNLVQIKTDNTGV